MRACGTYLPADLATTESEVSRALVEAGLPGRHARAWLTSSSARLHSQGRWSLDYDVELQVASFEVWEDGRLVFGLDDWLPLP